MQGGIISRSPPFCAQLGAAEKKEGEEKDRMCVNEVELDRDRERGHLWIWGGGGLSKELQPSPNTQKEEDRVSAASRSL